MVCVIDNSGSVDLRPNPCVFVSATSDGKPINKKLDSDSRGVRTTGRSAVFTVNAEDLVRLEMSSVDEVESVFVEPAPRRAGFHVFTIINERNPDVRAKIYRCEQAIMDEYKNLEFDFRIIARRNRDLKDIITDLGAPVFTRR
jgi:hypothetical protein